MAKPLVSLFLPTLLMGGAEKVLVELANGLSREGWTVDMLVMSRTGPLIDKLDKMVNLVNLDSSSYRQGILALSRYYECRRPTLILTSMYSTGLAAISARVLSRHRPKIILGAHSSLVKEIENAANLKDKYLLKPLSKILFPHADAIIAVSRGVASEFDQLINHRKTRLTVIYNPVIPLDFIKLKEVPVSHPWLVHESFRQYKVLITVGRLVSSKGYEVLLKAFSLVRKVHDCRLIIIGDGPLREALDIQSRTLGIDDYVDFLGWQSNPYPFLAKADLFLLASRWEGFANVIVEALACGCQVVATNCQYGPEEILEGDRYGRLAEVNNSVDIANKIIQVLNEPVTRHNKDNRMARGRKFSVQASVQHYDAFFSELLMS